MYSGSFVCCCFWVFLVFLPHPPQTIQGGGSYIMYNVSTVQMIRVCVLFLFVVFVSGQQQEQPSPDKVVLEQLKEIERELSDQPVEGQGDLATIIGECSPNCVPSFSSPSSPSEVPVNTSTPSSSSRLSLFAGCSTSVVLLAICIFFGGLR